MNYPTVLNQIQSQLQQYEPEEQEEALRLALQHEYKHSLYKTAKYLLGFSDLNRRTHGDMIDALEAPTKRKLIIMPRGTFKSTISAISYPIWLLMNNPNLRILIDSELYTNSTTYLRSIKQLLATKEFIEIFGDWRGEPWNEGEITIANRTTQIKEASITCGGVGTTKVGQHYDVIIGDDYNSPANSSSKEGCEKVIAHYKYNQSILEPEGTYVIVGTRYTRLDAPGHILDTLAQYEKNEERKKYLLRLAGN